MTALDVIAHALARLAAARSEADAHRALASAALELAPGSRVLTAALSEDGRELRAVAAEGRWPVAPKRVERAAWTRGAEAGELGTCLGDTLHRVAGGVATLCHGWQPSEGAVAVERLMGSDRLWAVALRWGDECHGGLLVTVPGPAAPTEAQAIQVLARQTALALGGRHASVSRPPEAAQAVARSEEILRLALDHLPGGAYIVDGEDRFVFMNRQLAREMRMRPEDAVGRRVDEIMPVADAATFAEEARLVRESGRPLSLERPGFGPRKSRWIAATKYPIVREGVADLLGGYSFDASQRHRAEIALRSVNADLEARVGKRTAQLERALSELEAFSYSVAHDLRSPLRAMNGHATIMIEDFGDRLGADALDHCERIIANSRRMGQLIDDLLEFSRLGRHVLAVDRVDMEALARACFAEVAGPGEAERVRFDVARLSPTWGDATMLRQVWAHLLGNSLKFSSGVNQPVIDVGCEETFSETVYWVQDNGIGFDMRHVGRLFRVFERLHGAGYEGSGIGLAMVRRAVESHGGRVWAEGAPGSGATVYFAIPRAQPKDLMADAGADAPERPYP